MYHDNSIKAEKRLRRMRTDPINMTISSNMTALPKDMDASWASVHIKNQLQKFFKAHIIQNKDRLDRITVYLSDVIDEKAIKLKNGQVIEVPQLSSTLEEADERLFIHVNHAVKETHAENLLITSSDTDVFVCAVHFYNRVFKANGLKELWTLSGKGQTTRYIPVHDLCEIVNKEIIEVLPAIHSLSGCDTTSKVGTKHGALARAKDFTYLIKDFGRVEMSDSMIENAEEYLIRVLAKEFTKIDDLRSFKYHRMKHLDFTKLPPTSTSLILYIKRAYLQANRWYSILNDSECFQNPENF